MISSVKLKVNKLELHLENNNSRVFASFSEIGHPNGIILLLTLTY